MEGAFPARYTLSAVSSRPSGSAAPARPRGQKATRPGVEPETLCVQTGSNMRPEREDFRPPEGSTQTCSHQRDYRFTIWSVATSGQ